PRGAPTAGSSSTSPSSPPPSNPAADPALAGPPRKIRPVPDKGNTPDLAVDTAVFRAPPDVVAEAAADFESYPVWAGAVRHVEVLERDAEGRATLVAFHASALRRSLR